MTQTTRLHASSVALDGRGVLVLGSSGSGKSSLALRLMALGAQLIADDQTDLCVRDNAVWACAPASIRGLIEARGIGLLRAEAVDAFITLVIDLDQTEDDRLPTRHVTNVIGYDLPCLYKTRSDAWPAAILQYLKAGRREP